MLAIGGVIGPGYFVGMGKGLATAGPAGLLICFGVVGCLLWVRAAPSSLFLRHSKNYGKLTGMCKTGRNAVPRRTGRVHSSFRKFHALYPSLCGSLLGVCVGVELLVLVGGDCDGRV